MAARRARATSPLSCVIARVWSWFVRNGAQRYAGNVSWSRRNPLSSPAAEPLRTAESSESDSSNPKYAVSWSG